MGIASLRVEEFGAGGFRAPAGVAGAVTRKVGRKQSIKPQLGFELGVERFHLGVDKQNRPVGISKNLLYDSVTAIAIGVDQAIKKAVAFRIFDFMEKIAFFLVAK